MTLASEWCLYCTQNSVYGLFPFFTPQTTASNLRKLGIVQSYTLERPVAKPVEKVVETVKEIEAILKDGTAYKTVESEVFAESVGKFSVVANVCVPMLGRRSWAWVLGWWC